MTLIFFCQFHRSCRWSGSWHFWIFLPLIGGTVRVKGKSLIVASLPKVRVAGYFSSSWAGLVALTSSGCSPVISRNVMTVSEMTQICGDEAGWRSGIQGVHLSQAHQGQDLAQTPGKNQGIQPGLKCVSGQSVGGGAQGRLFRPMMHSGSKQTLNFSR